MIVDANAQVMRIETSQKEGQGSSSRRQKPLSLSNLLKQCFGVQDLQRHSQGKALLSANSNSNFGVT